MQYKKPDYCPEWFDIDLYDNTTPCFNRNTWAMSIFMRKMQYCSNLNKEFKHEDRAKDYDINFIINCGTTFLEQSKKCSEYQYDNPQKDSDIVSDVKFSDIAYLYISSYLKSPLMYELFTKHIPPHLNEMKNLGALSSEWLVEDFIEDDVLNKDEIKEELTSLASDLGYSDMFHVSLSYSDEVLIEAFKAKLQEVRKREQSQGRRYSDTDISKLIEHKVLPYMDLYLWQQVTEINLTYAQLADLLYPLNKRPLNFDAVDRISRVTHKKAMKLFNEPMQLLI